MKYKVGQKINWHKATWDATPNPIAFAAIECFRREKNNFGFGRNFCLWVLKDTFAHMGYDKNDLYNVGKNIVNSWKKYLTKYKNFNKKALLACENLEKYGKYIEKINFKDLNEKELLQLYDELLKKYIIFFSWFPLEAIVTYLDAELEQHLKKFSPEIKSKITIPSKPSFLQKKNKIEIDIVRIILNSKQLKSNFRKIKNTKKLINFIEKKYPSLCGKIVSLSKKYHWIQNNYTGSKILGHDFFIKEIKSLLKKVDYNKKNLKKIDLNLKEQIEEKNKLIKKLKLSKNTKFLLNLQDLLTHYQDLRKGLAIKHIYHFDLVFKEISRQSKFKILDLKFLTSQEIKKIFNKKEGKKLHKIIKQRKKTTVFLWERGQKIFINSNPKIVKKYYKWITRISKTSSILKGTPASPGFIAKGKVRICLSVFTINKVKKNDILVATNTTPDYVPAMKKASAILTEKGGLTTHAAIVSRELKIPCIVGISNVAEVLKDGDLVEVDANKGVVKILKKALK